MKKLYLDCTEGEVVSVYVRDAEVIPAGTTVYTMPLRERGPAYDRWGKEYGIYFLFEDMEVEIPFYAVPRVDIFAVDGQGGFLELWVRGRIRRERGRSAFLRRGNAVS